MKHRYKVNTYVQFEVGITPLILEGIIAQYRISVNKQVAYRIKATNGIWYGVWAHRIKGF